MRIVVVVACMFLVVLVAGPAYCHPPKDIAITITGENLDVVVSHPVADQADHYIKSIQVSLNNTLLIKQTFFQQTGDKQIARYCIPGLKSADRVAVQADCSRFGSLIRTQSKD
jgi:hypothetical protein